MNPIQLFDPALQHLYVRAVRRHVARCPDHRPGGRADRARSVRAARVRPEARLDGGNACACRSHHERGPARRARRRQDGRPGRLRHHDGRGPVEGRRHARRSAASGSRRCIRPATPPGACATCGAITCSRATRCSSTVAAARTSNPAAPKRCIAASRRCCSRCPTTRRSGRRTTTRAARTRPSAPRRRAIRGSPARREAEFVAIMNALNLPRPKRIDEAVPANLTSGLRHDAGGGPLLEARPAAGYAGDVSPQLAYKWWRSGEAVLVDVRTDAEREWVGFIPDAVPLAWKQWPGMAMNAAFDAGLRAAVPQGKKVLCCCAAAACAPSRPPSARPSSARGLQHPRRLRRRSRRARAARPQGRLAPSRLAVAAGLTVRCRRSFGLRQSSASATPHPPRGSRRRPRGGRGSRRHISSWCRP